MLRKKLEEEREKEREIKELERKKLEELRRLEKEKKEAEREIQKEEKAKEEVHSKIEAIKQEQAKFRKGYDKYYKYLLILPVAMILFSIIYLISFYSSTGDIFIKDVTLTGGTTLTVYSENINISGLSDALKGSGINSAIIRSLSDFSTGKQLGIVIESQADPETLKKAASDFLGYPLDNSNSSIEFTGESLSSSFYKELLKAILLAFIFMAITVFIIFRKILPSVYVITCAFADIIIPITIIDIMGMPISTAGIAAFLMLIGYSVDTDILLTTKVIKQKEEAVNKRIFTAMRTGLTMSMTSFAAVFVAYLFVISPALKEVFLILSIGLLVDMIMTWMMNASLLKWYCDRKGLK